MIAYGNLYSKNEGDFSRVLGTNLLNFLKDRRYKVRNILDVACGTGEFASVMRNGCPDVTGIDFVKTMIDVAKKQVPDANFESAPLVDFDMKKTYDLVSMNNQVLNFALDTDMLDKMIANVAKHLNPGGIFVFDFKTPNATDNNILQFDETSEYDYFKEVTSDGPFYMKHEIYYVPSKDNYHKIPYDEKHRVWALDDILEALHKHGFYNENLVSYELELLKKPKKEAKIHVLAYKR